MRDKLSEFSCFVIELDNSVEVKMLWLGKDQRRLFWIGLRAQKPRSMLHIERGFWQKQKLLLLRFSDPRCAGDLAIQTVGVVDLVQRFEDGA